MSAGAQRKNATVVLAVHRSFDRAAHEAALVRRGFRVLAGNDYPQCLELLQYQLPNVLVLEAESPPGGGDGVLEVMQKRLEAQRVREFELTTEQNRSALDRLIRYTINHFSLGLVLAEHLSDRVDRLAATRRMMIA